MSTYSRPIKIEESWKRVLSSFFTSNEFIQTTSIVRELYKSKVIFPNPTNIFRAFNLCPFDSVKVVILGQDPYHGDGQADGLAFSVPNGISLPPSLRNIFQEISNDIGDYSPKNYGDLTHWAKQGVLLLNSILTVEAHTPASHQKLGWQSFTDEVIKQLSIQKDNIVFLLWGNYAKTKMNLIEPTKHLICTAAHPSPLSAHSGFFGCKHFSKANDYLQQHRKIPIIW